MYSTHKHWHFCALCNRFGHLNLKWVIGMLPVNGFISIVIPPSHDCFFNLCSALFPSVFVFIFVLPTFFSLAQLNANGDEKKMLNFRLRHLSFYLAVGNSRKSIRPLKMYPHYICICIQISTVAVKILVAISIWFEKVLVNRPRNYLQLSIF